MTVVFQKLKNGQTLGTNFNYLDFASKWIACKIQIKSLHGLEGAFKNYKICPTLSWQSPSKTAASYSYVFLLFEWRVLHIIFCFKNQNVFSTGRVFSLFCWKVNFLLLLLARVDRFSTYLFPRRASKCDYSNSGALSEYQISWHITE